MIVRVLKQYWALYLLSLIIVTITVLELQRDFRVLFNFLPAKGEIREISKSEPFGNPGYKYSLPANRYFVEFRAGDSKISADKKYIFWRRLTLKLGKEVNIFYNPTNPRDIEIYDYTFWFRSVMSVICTLLSFWLLKIIQPSSFKFIR